MSVSRLIVCWIVVVVLSIIIMVQVGKAGRGSYMVVVSSTLLVGALCSGVFIQKAVLEYKVDKALSCSASTDEALEIMNSNFAGRYDCSYEVADYGLSGTVVTLHETLGIHNILYLNRDIKYIRNNLRYT